MTIDLRLGDCVDILQTLDSNSVDAIVTDPPAGISFMGKEWDKDKGGRDKWITWMSEISVECLRVLKPGGYALVWSLPRTSHWTGMAWEMGGFDVRDRIVYCFGSGFPKSLDVSKAIDKAAGAEREVIGPRIYGDGNGHAPSAIHYTEQAPAPQSGADRVLTAPATPDAARWQGWGTALKPAIEDWWVFRKPLSEKTVAENCLRWGTGALAIDQCRVQHDEPIRPMKAQAHGDLVYGQSGRHEPTTELKPNGRFPANLITDGSDEVRAMFPQSKDGVAVGGYKTASSIYGNYLGRKGDAPDIGYGGQGSASRFFAVCPLDEDDYLPLYYCAKASKSERDAGCEGMEERDATESTGRKPNSSGLMRDSHGGNSGNPYKGAAPVVNNARNHHPTVKPLALMRYLITLCTRSGATVLDPFMGSGSTGVACVQLERSFIGCELDPEYMDIARARIMAATPDKVELPLFETEEVEKNGER